MKRSICFSCLTAIVAIITLTAPKSVTPTASAFSLDREPLYRFQSVKGNYLFKTGATLPAGLTDGPWNNEGIVAYVPHAAPHGTKPVYQLSKTDDIGVRYSLTTDIVAANSTTGWTNSGVAFYVASSKLAGTVPMYRLYKPLLAPEKKKDKNWLQKIGDAIAGEEFTTAAADVLQDTTFYTIHQDEKAVAINAGFTSQGILGYVWESSSTGSSGPALPDLIVQDTKADLTSVNVVLRNQGKANTGGVKYEVALLVYDNKKTLLYRLHLPAPGLSPNQTNQVRFETNGKSLMGRLYQVRIDAANAVNESDKDNNTTEMLKGPPVKLGPAKPDDSGLIRLALELKDHRETTRQGGQSQIKFTDYNLFIANANAFPKDAFQPINVLPPDPCGPSPSNARLFAQIVWGREGKDTEPIMRGTCIPLTSPQLLASMTFSLDAAKGTANLLQVIVKDRLTGLEHRSNIFKIDAIGVADVLTAVGCKRFLGRDDDFYCATKPAMAACENLKQKGKPIKCRLVGPHK